MTVKKRIFIIASVAFAIAATVLLLVGGYLAHWDIAAWFTSTIAYVVYVLAFTYAFVVVSILVMGKIREM